MYIARDKDGDLYLYRERPVKHDKKENWQPCSDNPHDFYKLDSSLFPEVKWEDDFGWQNETGRNSSGSSDRFICF